MASRLTTENQEKILFLNATAILFKIGITHCENEEVQIALFSKGNKLRANKLVQRFIFFNYLQSSVNKNS